MLYPRISVTRIQHYYHYVKTVNTCVEFVNDTLQLIHAIQERDDLTPLAGIHRSEGIFSGYGGNIVFYKPEHRIIKPASLLDILKRIFCCGRLWLARRIPQEGGNLRTIAHLIRREFRV